MSTLFTWLGSVAMLALLLSFIWTPWIAVVAFAAIALYFAFLLHRQRELLFGLLREPTNTDLPFLKAVMNLRARLRDQEQLIRERDAEVAQRKQITNAVPDGLFLLDEDDRILWCNQSALLMLSLDAFCDIGKPIGQLLRAPPFLTYLADESRDKPIVPIGDRSILFRIERDSDGMRLLLARDVTEREKLDRMRRDFVANVSHELRTPLTVMGGFVETLTDLPLDDAERQRYLQLMATQTTNMRRLVEDLLTLARLDNDQIPAGDSQVDLAPIVRDALADAEALSNGGHHFSAELAPQLLVRGSGGELRSAVSNLLSNAVRYTPPGGSIQVTLSARAARPCFEVRDTGVGIAPEHLPRLTERFYRVDRGRSRDAGGTGLGLAIVKHVAQRNRAQLEIESEPGRGSTFRLRFGVEVEETVKAG